jgi:predicted metal-binding membrane protein
MSPGGPTERLLRRDRFVVAALIAMLFALAALYTFFGVGMRMTAFEMTTASAMRDMHIDATRGVWGAWHALLVFLMWWVMMVAMMLPSVAPTVLLHTALLHKTDAAAAAPAISTAFLGGYLAVWATFSIFAAVAQWSLELSGLLSPTMMTLVGTLPGSLLLIAAGVFQFTPLKAACLQHCRSPARFLTERGRYGASGAFAMGVEHGTYCLGCCWSLMALLFVGGVMNLWWIVGLAALVGLEKMWRFGPVLGRIVGALMILVGAAALLSSM